MKPWHSALTFIALFAVTFAWRHGHLDQPTGYVVGGVLALFSVLVYVLKHSLDTLFPQLWVQTVTGTICLALIGIALVYTISGDAWQRTSIFFTIVGFSIIYNAAAYGFGRGHAMIWHLYD